MQDRKPGASQPPPPGNDAIPQPAPSLSPLPGKKRPSTSTSSPASSKRRPSTTDATAPAALSEDEALIANSAAAASSGEEPLSNARDFSHEGGGGGNGGRSDKLDGGVGGSPVRRSLARQAPLSSPSSSSSMTIAVPGTVPKTDWLSAAISRKIGEDKSVDGEREGGADAQSTTSTNEGAKNGASNSVEAAEAVVGGGGKGGGDRDAKLHSLLLLSPGREYWAGRIAGNGPRDSESPRTTNRSTGRNRNRTFGWADSSVSSSPKADIGALSPPAISSGGRNAPPSPAGRHPLRPRGCGGSFSAESSSAAAAGRTKRKEYLSFTAVKRVSPLSPGGGSTVSPSVWANQAFTSPTASGGDGASARGKGQPDPSPGRALQAGEVWSPSSTPSLSLHQASPSLLPLSPADSRIASARRDGSGTAKLGVSPAAAAGWGGGSFGRTLPLRLSLLKDPAGPGRGGGSTSADALTKQVRGMRGWCGHTGGRSCCCCCFSCCCGNTLL